MTWQNPVKRQRQGAMNATTSFRIVLIEISRSDLRTEAKGGKQIAAEKQPMPGGVVTAVPMRMPRQSHHTKTAPHRNFIAILE